MDEEIIRLQISSEDIDYLTKIIEACGHVGIVTTRDAASGLVAVITTRDTRQAVLEIIEHLPLAVQYSDSPNIP